MGRKTLYHQDPRPPQFQNQRVRWAGVIQVKTYLTKRNQHVSHSKRQKRPSFQRGKPKCDAAIGQCPWLFLHHKHKHQQLMR